MATKETWKTADGEVITTTRSRSNQVVLRLNDDELEQFHQLVEESGMSRQEYLRRAALGQKIVNTKGIEQLVPELLKEGNNLNQIARSLNSMGFVEFRSIDETTKELRELWRLLRPLMREIQSQMS